MRLTLRTLLAYMDDVLDPSDHEELGQKIEASEFATELIHRTRDAVRRLRLGAPEVLAVGDGDIHGGDSAQDANLVAEYLDSTVDPEQVAEFERGCLDAGPQSEMQLAEVASCHHILTMVLGEPAQVDEDLRRRIYALPQSELGRRTLRFEAAHPPLAADQTSQLAQPEQPLATTASPSPTPPETKEALRPRPRSESHVPDYLIEAKRQQRRNRRWAAAAALGTLLGAGVVFVLWPTAPPGPPAGIDADAIAQLDPLETFETPQFSEPSMRELSAPDATLLGENAAHSGSDSTSATIQPESEVVRGGGGTDLSPSQEAVASSDRSENSDPIIDSASPLESAKAPLDERSADGLLSGIAQNEAGASGTIGVDGDEESTLGIDSVASSSPAAASTAAPAESFGSVPHVSVPVRPWSDPIPPESQIDAALPDEALLSGAGAVSAEETPGLASESAGAAAALHAGNSASESGENRFADVGVVPPGVDLRTAVPGADGMPAPGLDAVSGRGEEGAEQASAAPAAGEEAAPRQAGSYLGNGDILLRYIPFRDAWLRLAPRTPLAVGDRLMALPTFRTHIVLSDANVYLGGCEIELLGAGGDRLAMQIKYGRVVVNSGLNGNIIALRIGNVQRELTLGPSSSLAIEVQHRFVPGDQGRPAPVEISWYVTSGTCRLESTRDEVSAPSAWQTVSGNDSPPQPATRLPEWIDGEGASLLDVDTQRRISDALAPGEPVNIRLLELNDPSARGRQKEVRARAAQCAASLGLFEPLINSLNDVDQRADWKRQIEVLRETIARDPAAVDDLRESLISLRGNEAAEDLLEMLLGYDEAKIGSTREQVQQGPLRQLVDWLDSDQLDYRVLAVHNINELTGTNYLGGYRPTQSAGQRQRTVRVYRDRLEKGDLKRRE